jgi:hypothetical protein
MSKRLAGVVGVFALLLSAGVQQAKAQTATTGAVVGSVTDQTGAVISGAKLVLTNTATNSTQTQTSNSAGQYSFPSVPPGTYVLMVTMQGFQTSTIPSLVIDVAKSYQVNVKMHLGAVTQTVQVVAGAAVELQTTDAQVGNVIGTNQMMRLPTLQHNAAELVSLQPTVTPGSGGSSNLVRVAGAIDDQNTVTLDGIDITENLVGNTLSPWIPIPLDSVEEFRVGVSDPNASYGRASGGQVSIVGRHGTNDFHGAVYWYTQNDELNANEWESNRTHVPRAELKDNRGGFRVGGPILKNKAWFFANYEIRRFPNATNVTKLVPTASLKAGILQFADASGHIDSYNLKTAANCGATGNLQCDPRQLGISPSVQAFWNLLPTGNDPSLGDGLNTIGYRSTVSSPLHTNYVVTRFDYSFLPKWHFYGSYTYSDIHQFGAQVGIENGNAKAVEPEPVRAIMVNAQLTTQISATTLNTFRFAWLPYQQYFNTESPAVSAAALNIPGTMTSAGPIAINPADDTSTLVDAPIDNNATNARFQGYIEKNIEFGDDINLVRGSHTLAFGADIRDLPVFHSRADKVVGSVTSLIATMDADINFLTIPSQDRPPVCSSSLTANCLPNAQVTTWDRLYSATLGMVDNVSVLAVRDGNLNPLPFGTPLENNTTQKAFYFYGSDSWRMRPSLTFTYGLGYGWQTPPSEQLGRQTILIDNTNNVEITAPAYLGSKASAATQGQVYNPQLAYVPLKFANGRQVNQIDWSNLSPRVALAWNPSFSGGLLGKMFGDRRTVLRGGYTLVFDRINTVQSVLIPMLGVGFGQTLTEILPGCNATSAGGANCGPSNANAALSSFRVGQDGTIPVPSFPKVSVPVVPTTPFGETLSFQDDPNMKVGRSNNFDFTIQRQIPGNMLLEIGWLGNYANHLPETVNLNNSPYFFKDPASGQTFAQAFDAVATELRNGQPVTTQPWFENELPGYAKLPSRLPNGVVVGGCSGKVATSTACLAGGNVSSFLTGLVARLFTTMDEARAFGLGLPSFDNLESQNQELRTYLGTSNYNALVVTLHKQTGHGLTYDLSYTFSKVLDQGLANQNSAGFYNNAYFPNVDYGPGSFDRTNTFTGTFVYNLPAGKGHLFHFNNSFADKFISGWYTSGVFSAFSGTPTIVTESSQVWGSGTFLAGSVGSVPTVNPSSLGGGVNQNITGSSTVASTGNPAKGGTGLNLFSNPAAAFADFQPVLISQDGRDGRANPVWGLGAWNLDMAIGKTTSFHERVNLTYTAQFLNIFNHPNFTTPSLSLTSPQTFGVISAEAIPANRTEGARWIEMGLRVEF